ncbi:uncharacterized protein BX664DRAFT_328869 [Halteromyces radiatus]|uniref:uncharacterized protein n=1 Tax=Halteromyces radiatus TaxID=101107 RepID=UPI00221FF1BB|nr:uncharacterized protein BX664DRAFT_328869 [Halteromyces radiatus]KAI8093077.1 hypothetical protein BX664DRAFT_328869 [Halteromyces radiatus]
MTKSKHGFSVTELTANKAKHLTRSPSFKKLTKEDLDYFYAILPRDNILVAYNELGNNDELLKHSTDWYNLFRGSPSAVLFPETTEQVSQLLTYCNKQHIAVVPQSGNTSASGGSVPVFDEIIISLKKMNKIHSFDELKGDLICDAGCVLEDVDEYLLSFGYQFPLDLPSRHLCQIGGNISTNAGGIRQMRFGNLHGNVTGLEVVTGEGTIINTLTTLRKDNTGYHLKNLFIGSEGTLAIVTKIAITTARLRQGINVFVFGFATFEQVVQAFSKAKKCLPETISAFEVLDRESIECVAQLGYQQPSNAVFPISTQHNLYVIMETAGTDPEYENKKAIKFTEDLLKEGIALNGIVAKDEAEATSFWSWRTMLPRAIVQQGPSSIHFDISLPLPLLYQLVTDTRAWARENDMIGKDIHAIFGYGHVGDGNMHLSIPALRVDEELRKTVDDFVYGWTSQYNGSISAEHGIGLMKRSYLSYTKSRSSISSMRQIKDVFDPNGILNPYKLLPTEKEENDGAIIRKRADVGC